jgi:hypothetical protein
MMGAGMARDDRAAGTEAQRATDRLALALEDAGFDVGQEFPALHDAIGRHGIAVVRIGDVHPAIADRLAAVVILGASQTAIHPEEDDHR